MSTRTHVQFLISPTDNSHVQTYIVRFLMASGLNSQNTASQHTACSTMYHRLKAFKYAIVASYYKT